MYIREGLIVSAYSATPTIASIATSWTDVEGSRRDLIRA
jgi:hypothetical protein